MPKTNVPALDKAFAILDLLAKTPGLSFTEIHTQLNLPKSSAHNLMATLVNLGMVRQQEDKEYVLGLRLLELGASAGGQRRIDQQAYPILSALSASEKMTCHIGVLEGYQAVYLSKVESEQEIKINTWVGRRLSLNRSALGKVLIAWLPETEVSVLLSQTDWQAKTPKTITNPSDLMENLKLVREQGWAYDDEEDVVNIRCIAAPVKDDQGKVIAAISAVGTVLQVSESRVESLAKKVCRAAEQISESIRS